MRSRSWKLAIVCGENPTLCGLPTIHEKNFNNFEVFIGELDAITKVRQAALRSANGTITSTKCITVMKAFLLQVIQDSFEFNFTECFVVQNWKKFLSSAYEKKLPKEEEIMINAIKNAQKWGLHNFDEIIGKLISVFGFNYTIKHEKFIKLYLQNEHHPFKMNEREIILERSNVDNLNNFLESFNLFYKRVMSETVEIKHREHLDAPFSEWSENQLKHYMVFYSFLPFCTQRFNDDLPSLYLFGCSGCGKSHMYENYVYYKKINTDCEGVGRFKMDLTQSCLFFDDIKNAFFNKPVNQDTVKHLARGNSASIKVNGDTKKIVAFIIITSNDKPDVFKNFESGDKSLHNNSEAILRRFIFIEFKERLCQRYNLIYDYKSNVVPILVAYLLTNLCDSNEYLLEVDSIKRYHNHMQANYLSNSCNSKDLFLSIPDNLNELRYAELSVIIKEIKSRVIENTNRLVPTISFQSFFNEENIENVMSENVIINEQC